MQTLTVNLSELYKLVNEFEINKDTGFTHKLNGGCVYISPNNQRLMVIYVIQKFIGVSDSVHIIDDMEEYLEEEDSIAFSLSELRNIVDNSASYGMYFSPEKSVILERLPFIVIEGLHLSGNLDSDVEAVMDAVQDKLQELMPEVNEEELDSKSPRQIYIGAFDNYMTYRHMNELMASKYGVAVIFFNRIEYEKSRKSVEYEQMKTQFKHMLYNYSDSEVYTFEESDRFVQMFAGNRWNGSRYETTDIRLRPVKQKFFQILEMYEWIMSSQYKVFMFSTSVWEMDLDISFYAALVLAQQSKRVKVLLANSAQFDKLMAEIVNLQFADFYSRFRNVFNVYKANTIRVLANNGGRKSIAVVRDVNMNLRFSGLSIQNISEMVKKSENGEYEISLDSNQTSTDNFDILTNSEFNRYNAAGFRIKPINVFDVLYKLYSVDNDGAAVDRGFEGYLYLVCRLLDQLLTNYKSFSTIRDLACFQVTDANGGLQGKVYIGLGYIQPEATCDVVTLSDEGSIVTGIKYSGDMLDINAVDDIELLRFKSGINSDSQVGVLDKLRIIYEDAGVHPPECLDSLDQSRMSPLAGFSAFMSMVYSAGITTNMEMYQDIYSLEQDSAYALSGETRVMHENRLAPIYFGLALTRNWFAFKYLTPFVLSNTTSFGYRQVKEPDSPVNVFGGVNLDKSSNMWLYPQLFQHHRPVAVSERR